MLRSSGRLLPFALVVLLVAACGDDGGSPDATSSTTTSTTAATVATAPDGELGSFDWEEPTPTGLGSGWTIDDCDGDAPILCLTHEDGRTTILEHLSFDAPEGDLRSHAEAYVDGVTTDRTSGCEPGYAVDADLTAELDAPDGPVLRYGFLGGTGDVPTERTVQWAGLRDGRLVIVTLAGFDPGSCLAPEGEGTVRDVGELIAGLDALIAAAGLPSS